VFRIGHGWWLRAAEAVPAAVMCDFLRPAVHAVPPAMARQLGDCRVSLVDRIGSASVASRWSQTEAQIEILLATAGRGGHDLALELLVCLGQALWEKLNASQRKAYWLLLDDEIGGGSLLARGRIHRGIMFEKSSHSLRILPLGGGVLFERVGDSAGTLLHASM
jgi:hypothetical protein